MRRPPPLKWSTAVVLLCSLLLFSPSPPLAGEDAPFFRQSRDAMVRTQLKARNIADPATLRAMAAVPRHRFVAESLARRAYDDGPLPIGYGQTISQPYIVAYMTELVRPAPGKKVLEIGTGSGYQAAVLAEAGMQVFTVEIIPELARSAAVRLQALGYGEVRVQSGDGYFGWEAHAPFDAIVVTAATEFIPPPLLAQLKKGGRMIIPVGTPYFVQTLMLVENTEGEILTRSLLPVRFVPFRRAE